MKTLLDFIRRNKKVYIVGTSTDVGKTFIGTMLYKELLKENPDFHIYKPIETGAEGKIIGPDTSEYIKTNNKLTKENVNLYTIDEPCSPHLSAFFQNINISLESVRNFISEKENALIELAGGLLVPINENQTQFDLLKSYPNAIVLVSTSGLGTLNHVLLTIEAIKNIKTDIPIHLVLNFFDENNLIHQKNKEYLEKRVSVSFITRIDYM
jgi:dethiobiotin synthetase